MNNVFNGFGIAWAIQRPVNSRGRTLNAWRKDRTPDAWVGGTLYNYGHVPPRYPMPAIWDKYPDQEYLIMMYERAKLEQELRDIREEQQH